MQFVETRMELSSKIPLNIGIFIPYLFSFTPIGQPIWDRIFVLHTGKVVQALVEQQAAPSTQLQVRILSETELNQKEVEEVKKRLEFELGTNETLRELKVLANRDPIFKKALFSCPGFRIFANSNYEEAYMMMLLRKTQSVPINYIIMEKMVKTLGEQIPWNSNRFVMPPDTSILELTPQDWRNMGVKGNVKHFHGAVQKMEEAKVYTFYPIPERGYAKLKNMSGIGPIFGRNLQIYLTRNYIRGTYDFLATYVLKELYQLPDAISLETFDVFMERFHPVPALAIQVLTTYAAPHYVKDLHNDFDLYR